MRTFTCRNARSGALVVGVGLVVAIETVVLHLWLVARHPAVAWALTGASILTMLWLVADWRAMGDAGVVVGEHDVSVRIGRRFVAEVPRAGIAAWSSPTWRDLPSPESRSAAGFMDLTKPAPPNVLLVLEPPATVRLPGGLRRRARQVALHMDDPAGFLAALDEQARAGT